MATVTSPPVFALGAAGRVAALVPVAATAETASDSATVAATERKMCLWPIVEVFIRDSHFGHIKRCDSGHYNGIIEYCQDIEIRTLSSIP